MNRSYVTFERIGTCELCGATDHHLVEGVCPVCRPKVMVTHTPAFSRQQGKREALAQMVDAAVLALKSMARAEEVPLGAEASVSHVRVPKGRAR